MIGKTFFRSSIVLLVLVTLFCKKKGAEDDSSANPYGYGPIQSALELGAIDGAMAAKGKDIFEAKCSACHKIGERYVGPDLGGITKKRKPEWIMNMILNPVEMTQKDPDAQALLAEFATQMTFQNVSTEDVRNMLEYFRQQDESAPK